jgi:hypothetical protein
MITKMKAKVEVIAHAEYADTCEWCGKHIAIGSKKVIRIEDMSAYCSLKCEREDRRG